MANLQLLVDTETTGREAGGCVLQIAAFCFDPNTRYIEESLNLRINHKLSLEEGFVDEPETITWWNTVVSKEARERAFSGELSPQEAFNAVHDFLKPHGEKIIWANGPDFDLQHLKYAFKKYDLPIPWKFYLQRDVRTINGIFPAVKKAIPFEGLKHDAYFDGKHHINCLSACLSRIYSY